MVEMHKEKILKRRIHYSSIVSDDDCTMKACLRHSHHDLIKAGQMEKRDWPKTKSGAKKR